MLRRSRLSSRWALFCRMVMRESPLSHRAAKNRYPSETHLRCFFLSVAAFDPTSGSSCHCRWAVVAIIGMGNHCSFLLCWLRYPMNTAMTVPQVSRRGEFSSFAGSVSRWGAPQEGESHSCMFLIHPIPTVFRT